MHKDTIKIALADGATERLPIGITSLEIAQQRGKKSAQSVLVALVNEALWDVTRPIREDATVQLLTWEDDEGKKNLLALCSPSDGRSAGSAIPRH